MKINWLYFIIFGILVSCNNSSKTIQLNADSLATADVEEKLLIVPGKSIGRYFLGQDVQQVDSIKGKPDAGDAAMGKAWAIWYGKNTTNGKRNELAIYSSYKDSTMASKAVKQIRVISSKFETNDGLNNGNTLSNFQVKYPDFKQIAVYYDSVLGDTIKVYDSQSNGIAVEFLRDISRAITVHAKGEALNESYYTLKPGLTKLAN
ncbi:MAG: hypothetical protein REI78_09550 [Pedobacter sp.]|nr:hypothetical protein [Pedobacter sp.]MDQ8053260.1 hypothetical protein [Pedobacter sp.]